MNPSLAVAAVTALAFGVCTSPPGSEEPSPSRSRRRGARQAISSER